MTAKVNEKAHPIEAWTTPQLAIYGTVEQMTQQIKNKTWGAGDDVLINEQSLLADPPAGS